MKKILILAKNIDGGTGTFLFNFLKIRSRIGKKVVIRVLILEKPRFRKIDNELVKNFIFLRPPEFYPQFYHFSIKNILNFLKELTWVKNQIADFQPTLVLSVDIHCNLLLILNKLLFHKKIKTILTTHIDLRRTIINKSSPFLSFILRKLINFFYNQADILVCVSKNLSLNLKKNFNLKKDIATIYNGAKCKYNPQNKVRGLSKENKIIISIARLFEQKDHETIIKSFKILQEKLPNTQLWILSDGPMKRQLINIVKKFNLVKKIKFLGWVENIFPFITKSDLFVLSSKREGFNYTLLEAMSQGLPVVSTDTPYGPSEILDNGRYGVLVPMKDPQAMAKAMYELLTDKKKYNYYSKKSLERVKYFSLEKMLRAYKKIILELANK